MTRDHGRLDQYFRVMREEGSALRKHNLQFELTEVFRNVELAGKSVLDIGAGRGYVSLFCACAGARKVVALEPEAAGSSTGMLRSFGRVVERLGLEDRVELQPITLQDYDPGSDRFDVFNLSASVNHLDEDACIRLHRDDDALDSYREIFRKLAGLATPSAKLLISDCARRNLFADLGLRNPFAPSIEWHKHQAPQLWASLLDEQGFGNPSIRWKSFNSLRTPGRLLLGNRAASYMLTSVFSMTVELRGDPSRSEQAP
jgi:SAM-dependent methyltransferase